MMKQNVHVFLHILSGNVISEDSSSSSFHLEVKRAVLGNSILLYTREIINTGMNLYLLQCKCN